jgi:hypothetical protein
MRFAAIALAALAACASPQAATPTLPREPPVFVDALDTVFDTGEDPGGSRAQLLAFLGREDLIQEREHAVCTPLMRDGAVVDPAAEIARLAADRRVVILNEAHDHPQHRAFIGEVASALRRDGFSIYAAETFAPSVREDRGWPSLRDGYYTHEPAYAALVRRARAEGFQFFDYEHYPEGDDQGPADGNRASLIAEREAGQAANLKAILDAHPDARIFIHAGHGHIQELPDHEGNLWMAQRLKDATGIDPLTVDLTRFASPTDEFVWCDPAQFEGMQHSVDFRVGTPALTFTNGRPAWRQAAGQKPVLLPAMSNPRELTIWEVRYADEPDDALAVDRIALRPGERLPLLLPPGRYRAESWTVEHGWSTSPIEFRVE